MADLRPDLPEPPDRIARLPVHRGYPVPWFVAWLDPDERPLPRGEGTPDFRVIYPGAIEDALRRDRCWICGGRLGYHRTFVISPMCAVTRTSTEPPSHDDCADWSARACPFLARPHMTRREAGLPAGTVEPPGVMLRRNPGVILLWRVRQHGYRLRPVDGRFLLDVGDPDSVAFYAEGRPATRAEVDASIASGLPVLREIAAAQGDRAVRELDRMARAAEGLLPA